MQGAKSARSAVAAGRLNKTQFPPQLSRGEILDTFGLDPEIAAVAAVPAIVRNEESGQLLSPAIVWKLPPGQFPGEIIKKAVGFPSKLKSAIFCVLVVRTEKSGQLPFPAIVRKLPPGQLPGEIVKSV